MSKTAGIIIIGNEILSGKVQDSNSHYLAAELRALGVDVRRVIVIPDEQEIIASEALTFSETYDFVFTSGGVGPTHDDVTIRSIAHGLGLGTRVEPRLARIVEQWCTRHESESSMKMAEVPEGAEIIETEGLVFPPIRIRNIYIFPGIPQYLRTKFAAIRERFRCVPFFLKKVYINIEECSIVRMLDAIDEGYPDVMVGSYPKIDEPDYKVVVTLESTDVDLLGRAHGELVASLPEGSVLRTE